MGKMPSRFPVLCRFTAQRCNKNTTKSNGKVICLHWSKQCDTKYQYSMKHEVTGNVFSLLNSCWTFEQSFEFNVPLNFAHSKQIWPSTSCKAAVIKCHNCVCVTPSCNMVWKEKIHTLCNIAGATWSLTLHMIQAHFMSLILWQRHLLKTKYRLYWFRTSGRFRAF